MVSTLVGSGLIGSNLLESGGDCGGVAVSSSSKICATIVLIRAPRVLKKSRKFCFVL